VGWKWGFPMFELAAAFFVTFSATIFLARAILLKGPEEFREVRQNQLKG
jgi:hypothetical protein